MGVDKQKAKEALDQVFRDMAGAMTAGMVHVGVKTGLFRAMAGKGALSLSQVIEASKLQPRYVEEWLKGMVASGYLSYDPAAQTYTLSEEHAYFLASDDTDHFVGGLFAMVPPLLRVAPQVARAFAEGGGVQFEHFGPDCVSALDLINRGQYESRFADYWLQSLPDTAARLAAGGRALDVGCGSGAVCAALARAFPKAEIIGIDPDAESIRRARADAPANAKFEVSETSKFKSAGFDLVTLCDVLHDLAEPLKTLREIRALLKPDGTLFIVEPRAADRLEDNRNPVAATFYGFSVFHCMTQSLARGGPGLGTCLGPAATEALVRQAGYTRFQRLDIRSLTNLFYSAQP
ncbi:MAG TPA: class I SAM-dependent methyltransferase [Burkholderiales bacterium]|nr:class I SAM-dependent methyltransferase [Burkholderiales bacterium]